MKNHLNEIVERVFCELKKIPANKNLLVGISGIDASGKGFITAKLAEKLRDKNLNAANINIDGWLNLPHIRFNNENPGRHFYEFGIRFDEMFEKLIFPLQKNRSIKLTANFMEETAARYRKENYEFKNIDVILLEGIFLFKNEFKNYFDLKIWIECSFKTALKRAVSRSQENLSPEETVKAYETIYFPAQKIHFQNDKPRASADLIFHNF